MIDLYGMSSPNVSKVVIALEELEVAYNPIHADVFRGRAPELAAISPFGKAPAIVDRGAGGLAVFESGAILVYLAETYGGQALLPASGPARYRALQWLAAQVATVGPLLGQNNHFLLLPQEAGSYAARRYADQARRIYRVLDDRLSAAPWLGEDYSIADIATYPWANYLPRHGLNWRDYPALKAWSDRIAQRPAVVRAKAAMSTLGEADRTSVAEATAEELDRFFWREAPGPAADFAAFARTARER